MKNAFAPIVFPDSKILILGTMPGDKSLELKEYYGNRNNQFWRILFSLFKEEPTTDYNAKISLLQKNCIALWDVLEMCEREGSLDSNIRREVPNDFEAFYAKHPHIRFVFFSSKNAAAYYKKHIGMRAGIAYEILPSPSGANAAMPYLEKLEIWKQKILPVLKK
ncbi:DNA-deoxyinosine glycosylase [uncultured Flavobacterium sp.]|uniref:DNA-deoxyinosine glycosylase n=1 Tax=uncultured Flavobacterium sp. TaxID=165435 RepID=UPI0025EA7EA7|nr:DNA-deoxyinosine glycosylase [uncultured Flavobacterium sp.]